MFAALRASSCPVTDLAVVAQDFTPRFEMLGEAVLLDVGGLARLFGGPDEIGDYLFRAACARASDARVAIAPTATTALLLVLGRPGLSIISAHEMNAALAVLPVSVLGAYERIRGRQAEFGKMRRALNAGGRSDLPLPSRRLRTTGGWQHPRHTHQAGHTRVSASSAASVSSVSSAASVSVSSAASVISAPSAALSAAAKRAAEVQATLDLLARWGVTTLGMLAALPRADISERLGEEGTRWQRLAHGEDERPLVPWVAEEPFEASIELEWPIEGLEPLSFVLTRLLEPLAERLERADRGAAIVHTRLRLVDKTTYARQVQLPAPMRDPKTLRTLQLLDLETHPPDAAVDRVGVLIEPTPGRVLQWALFERAQPSPEQVSTLLARLTALMGEGHVGSPTLVNSWRPGAFEMTGFRVHGVHEVHEAPPVHDVHARTPRTMSSVIRRFRLPVPARVRVHEGRPVRVQIDRRGLVSGAVMEAAGPWRTSGAWWEGGQDGHHASSPWDRDEWDVALGDGTIYRLFVERAIGQWFIEGVID